MDKKDYKKPDMKTIMLDHQPLLQGGSPDPHGENSAPRLNIDED